MQSLHPYDAYVLRYRLRASLSPTKSPVFTACAWGFYEVVRTALSRGFNLEERNMLGNTALIVAAEFKNIEIVKLLLEKGADANAVGGQDGYVPLHHGYASLELVKLLINQGQMSQRWSRDPLVTGGRHYI